jgi:hypothetical protein
VSNINRILYYHVVEDRANYAEALLGKKEEEKKQRIEQPTNTEKSGLIQSVKIRMGHTMLWCGSHA